MKVRKKNTNQGRASFIVNAYNNSNSAGSCQKSHVTMGSVAVTTCHVGMMIKITGMNYSTQFCQCQCCT